MTKYFSVFAAVFAVVFFTLLSGCKDEYTESTYSTLPSGLKDCSFFTLSDGLGVRFRVVRCPNSVTATTITGKNSKPTIVIDGVEYERKSEQPKP